MEEFELEETEEKKHYFIIGLVVFIFLGCSIAFYIIKKDLHKEEKNDEIVENDIVEENPEKEEPSYLKVDIKGAVQKPGVYEVIEGSRVIDVIEKAGGLRKDANTSFINLSKKITDEMTVIIYTEEDIEEWRLTDKLKEYDNEVVETKCPDNINQACINESSSNKGKEEKETNINQKVSLNNASKEELMTLSGIGESKANDILEYRKDSPFKTIEEIKNIKGIGDSIFEKIKNSITI